MEEVEDIELYDTIKNRIVVNEIEEVGEERESQQPRDVMAKEKTQLNHHPNLITLNIVKNNNSSSINVSLFGDVNNYTHPVDISTSDKGTTGGNNCYSHVEVGVRDDIDGTNKGSPVMTSTDFSDPRTNTSSPRALNNTSSSLRKTKNIQQGSFTLNNSSIASVASVANVASVDNVARVAKFDLNTIFHFSADHGTNLLIREKQFSQFESVNKNTRDTSIHRQIISMVRHNFEPVKRNHPTVKQTAIYPTRSRSANSEDNSNVAYDEFIKNNIDYKSNRHLHGYFRCFVEDFMLIEKHQDIILLLPKKNELRFKAFKPDFLCCINKNDFKGYKCKIVDTSHLNRVINGLTGKELEDAFETNLLGSTVQICNPEIPRRTSNKFSMQEKVSSIIIPWAEVLSGRDTGIQVWQIADGPCRDLSRDIFRNHRNEESRELYVEYLLPEIVGDPVQVSHLLLLLYRSNNQRLKEQNARLTKQKKKNNDNKRNSNLYGDMYNSLLSRIDNKFKSAIKKTFHTFTAYDEPMLTLQDLEDIVEDYKKSLPEHYTAMRRILNFDKKEQETRNMHLTQTNYYKKRLLDIFMSQARIVNSHNLVHYGVVTAGACYGRGVNSKALTHATHAGISTNYRTMMRKVKEYGESMEKTLMDILEYENRIVAVLDNNQKGNSIKFQVDGRSNAFVVVTGRLFKRCNKFELIPGHPQLSNQAEIENRTDLTYVNQKIPSMFYMPIIENISDDTANNIKIIGNIDYATKSDGTIDFSGRRVQRYYEICLKCDVVHNVIRKHFTNYVLHDNKYRPFQHQPIQFITERRKTMTKKLASLKHKTNVFTVFSKWQDKMLDTVDESRNNTSKVFIPGVSLREETTTNGYGMAVVEILELSGIVKKTQTPYDDTPFWKLTDNYKDKILYLSMDGLFYQI